VVPSANLPVATSGIVMPSGTLAGEGVITIDCSGEDSTTTFAVPRTPLNEAVIVELPADCPVTSPMASTVADVGSDDVQVATFDRDCVELSENVPVAENPSELAGAMVAVAGFTVIDVSVAEVTVRGVVPVTPPKAAMIVAGPVVRV